MLVKAPNLEGGEHRRLTDADLLTRHERSTEFRGRDLRQVQGYNVGDLSDSNTGDDAPDEKICDTLSATAKSTSYSE